MYAIDEELSYDEDIHYEFKMHTKNMLCEFPRRSSYRLNNGRIGRTMQPNSKTIGAFLNTDGGRLILGVDDLGIVRGVEMTRDQRDHFMLSLRACLHAFQPTVPPHLVKVHFDQLEMKKSYDPQQYIIGDSDDENGWDFDDDDGKFINEYNHDTAYHDTHTIGSNSCNCDRGVGGLLKRLYVITVCVSKSDDGTIYQNEEGLVYQRRHGSNRMISIDRLKNFLKSESLVIEKRGEITYTRRKPPQDRFTDKIYSLWSLIKANFLYNMTA